jgi:hypothetical protein
MARQTSEFKACKELEAGGAKVREQTFERLDSIKARLQDFKLQIEA